MMVKNPKIGENRRIFIGLEGGRGLWGNKIGWKRGVAGRRGKMAGRDVGDSSAGREMEWMEKVWNGKCPPKMV
jgi:hypothetical protein